MKACLYHLTWLNLAVVWLFYEKKKKKQQKTLEKRQRDQSKDTKNLPGLVSLHLFCNADREGVDSKLSQLQQESLFP